ncbi:MAG: protein arginine kinase [Clostridioides sp.]|jgi:protein arginine kinase|nr:protein arginine kinase [Clostridioides sp.]
MSTEKDTNNKNESDFKINLSDNNNIVTSDFDNNKSNDNSSKENLENIERLCSSKEMIIKSRVRLARNLACYPFPTKMNSEQAKEIVQKVKSIFIKEDSLTNEFEFYDMNTLDKLSKINLVEEHLISPDLSEKADAGVLINKDKNVSIMINEEDHIRIQAICDSDSIYEAYEIANKYDEIIEKNLEYAFDPYLGYLTSCPTNVGTGIRASAMIHLSAISQLKYINEMYKILAKIGMTMRGIYGERSEALGNIYQISNQLTLGKTEKEIVELLYNITGSIVDKEKQARDLLEESRGIEYEDKIFRSLGILLNSRVINTKEAMEHLSNLKTGISLGLIKPLEAGYLDRLTIDIQPAHQSIMSKDSNLKSRDANRARYIRESLKQLN